MSADGGAAYRSADDLPELREPDRVAPNVGILDHMRHHDEADPLEQVALFEAIEARVKEWLASVRADGFAVRWSARELQCRTRGGVPAKDREHPPLVVMVEMKEAVPGEEAIEGAAQRQRPHVRHTPISIGKINLAMAIISAAASMPVTRHPCSMR
jgi:hypothetical protein